MSQKSKKEQLDDLRAQQLEGTAPKVKANKADVEIPEAEKGFVHLELIQRVHNPATRKYDEHKGKQQFSPKDFERMEKEGAFQGYDEVNILHDPRTAAEKKAATKKELQSTYTELYGEAPDTKLTVPELEAAIKEKQGE